MYMFCKLFSPQCVWDSGASVSNAYALQELHIYKRISGIHISKQRVLIFLAQNCNSNNI